MDRAALPVVLTLLLVVATMPHAAEDFRYGEFARFGVPDALAACALAVVYAVQLGGIVLALRGSRAGYVLMAAGGLVWCIGAVAIHGRELLSSGPYRNGVESKALEAAIIVLGAAVGAVAIRNGRLFSEGKTKSAD